MDPNALNQKWIRNAISMAEVNPKPTTTRNQFPNPVEIFNFWWKNGPEPNTMQDCHWISNAKDQSCHRKVFVFRKKNNKTWNMNKVDDNVSNKSDLWHLRSESCLFLSTFGHFAKSKAKYFGYGQFVYEMGEIFELRWKGRTEAVLLLSLNGLFHL